MRMAKVQIFTLVLLAGLVGNIHGEGDGTNFCGDEPSDTLCFCDTGSQPIEIICESLGLKVLFEESDWNATFLAMNMTGKEALDVSFAYNEIEDITRFPPLNIVMLSFHKNKIRTITPSAFADLDDLNSLNLSYNELTADSIYEGAFYGQFNSNKSQPGYFTLPLKHLNLSHNFIHSIGKDSFDHFASLTTLDLGFNPLKVLANSASATAISSLYKLEYLGLSNTSISSLSEGMLHELRYLTALDLSYNLFETVPSELTHTHQLSVLNLDGNIFQSLDKSSFDGMGYLADLSIRYVNTLRKIEEFTFETNKNLTKLEISFNRRLDEIDDGAFKGLIDEDHKDQWPIKDLRLNDNGLTTIDRALALWEYIDYVDIQNNPFRCDCNLEWMVKVLVDRIKMSNPIMTVDLTCAEPKDMKGRSIDSLAKEPERFSRCTDGSMSLSGSGDEYDSGREDPYRSAGVTVLVIGILLIFIGLSILGFVVVKRRAIAQSLMAPSQIRYERAETEEGSEWKYNQASSIYK